MINNPQDYINHSGGAKGADMEWDRIGRLYGVTNHIHYRPVDLRSLFSEQEKQMLRDVYSAAQVLQRPHDFKGVELVHRNWLQVINSEAIFAISRIIDPGETDFKGFENKTGKQIVAGGTGWAVEMAIQKGMPVYIFDMKKNRWNKWSSYNQFLFEPIYLPSLTKQFTGIGSRQLTKEGTQAIIDVYEKTFNQ